MFMHLRSARRPGGWTRWSWALLLALVALGPVAGIATAQGSATPVVPAPASAPALIPAATTTTMTTIAPTTTATTVTAPAAAAAPVPTAAVPSPKQYLGYQPGADYHLTPWNQIVGYLDTLARSSPRAKLVRYGQTPLGRDMVYLVVSSESTMKQLDSYRQIIHQLADPRRTSEAQARQLAAEGKPIYWIGANIHSNEVGSAEMVMELAYKLVTASGGPLQEILDHLIVIIDPSVNPDGHDLYTDWYNQYKGTDWEDSRPPYYSKYVSHDNNRDWFALVLPETQQEIAQRNDWLPTIFHDLHQSGPARMWVNPTIDPNDPNISPITQAQWAEFGGFILGEMSAAGFAGVTIGQPYDNWYPGYHDSPTTYHNGMGMLFETHGGTGASPENKPPKKFEQQRTWYHPFPWTGGWWRLRDNVEWQENGVLFSLQLAAFRHDSLLLDFYRKGVEAIRLGESQPPYAFILPVQQKNPVALAELLANLQDQLIEVHRATADFRVAGNRYDAGDYIIFLNQPYGRLAKTLLEVQKYPGDVEPYDVTAWTYGLLRGVTTIPVSDKGIFSAPTQLVTERVQPRGQWHLLAPSSSSSSGAATTVATASAVDSAPATAGRDRAATGVAPTQAVWHLVTYQGNNNVMRLLNRLWASGEPVRIYQAQSAGKLGAATFAAGDLLIDGLDQAQAKALTEELGLVMTTLPATSPSPAASPSSTAAATPTPAATATATAAAATPARAGVPTPFRPLRQPRIGLYHGWTDTIGEGWARLLLDRYGWSYDRLDNAAIRSADLSRYDVLIFPDMRAKSIYEGSTSLPPEYQGGIGGSGIANLRRYVNGGGRLVLLGRASELAVTYNLGLPLELADCSQVNAPGSILKVDFAPTAGALAYGYEASTPVFYDNDPAFLVTRADQVKVVATYASQPLLSGYLSDERNALSGKVAALIAASGAGDVVLFSPDVTYRGQATVTLPLLWNALLSSPSAIATPAGQAAPLSASALVGAGAP